ncbi:MAG TPA: hypothetical protein VFZ61_08790, partial [Polyangiales bacterium]
MSEGAWRSRPMQQRALGLAVFAYGSLAAACFSFLVYHRQGLIVPIVDLNGFGGIAHNLAEGRGFSAGYGETVRRAPLYPLLGAALLKLFGTSSPSAGEFAYFRPLLVANCLFFGLTCLVVYKMVAKLLGSRVGLLAAA